MSEINNDDSLWQEYVRDFLALKDRPDLLIQINPVAAWCLASALQLACRHPHFDGPASQISGRVARAILSEIADTPALRTVAERGWDPAYDEEVNDD